MSVQQTLIIVKPDGLVKGLVSQILYSIESNGLSVIDHVRVHLKREWVEKLYAGEEQEVYFEEVVNWVSFAPVLFLKIQGEEAVKKVKWHIIGRYPNGIRGQYSENWIKNIAHVPDSEEAAKRELMLSEPIFERRKMIDNTLLKGKIVFALTGMSECGKSSVGKYLDLRGIRRLKIVKIFERVRDKWSSNEDIYQFTGREEKRDPYALWDAFVEELLAEMQKYDTSMVSIESLYGGGFGPYLKQRMGKHFCIIYIDIPLETRLQRQMQRERLTTIEEAKKILLPRDEIKTTSGIPALKEIAGEIVNNSGTLEDLHKTIDEIITRYKKEIK